jgi:hypothetical protein
MLMNDMTGSKVEGNLEVGDQRKVCEIWPGRRIPSVHILAQVTMRLESGMLQSSFCLLTCDLKTKW